MDPFRSLKYLPWATLFQNAALTTLVASAIDILLMLGIRQLVLFNVLRIQLLALIIFFLAAAAIGALGVWLMDRFFPQVYLNAGCMWALIGCLILTLWLKSLIPVIPSLFTKLDYNGVIGIVLGVFWQGRRYWRR